MKWHSFFMCCVLSLQNVQSIVDRVSSRKILEGESSDL